MDWSRIVPGTALVLVLAAPAAAVGIGQQAPHFTLPDWDGRETTFLETRDQVTVIDFWASWCAPCAPMLPALDDLAQRLDGRLRVLAINIDQSRARADEFLGDHLPSRSSHLILLRDGAANVLARYGAAGMPAVFVVDSGGTVRFTDAGYSREQFAALERAVRHLAAGPRGAAGASGPSRAPDPAAASNCRSAYAGATFRATEVCS